MPIQMTSIKPRSGRATRPFHAGGVTRSGGGNGTIQGNMVVSPYSASYMADNVPPLVSDRFLAPQYDLSGGGNSEIRYNSAAVAGGLVAVSNFVLGVAEK